MLDEAEFEKLLLWLDPDPDHAGLKYEVIRQKLIRYFAANRRCSDVENLDLTDETIDRVAHIIAQGKIITGEPSLFFLGVAKRVALERHRRPEVRLKVPIETLTLQEQRRYLTDGSSTSSPLLSDEEFERFERGLAELHSQDRKLITEFYQGDGPGKSLTIRQRLAAELGIKVTALRARALRIRRRIEKYVGKRIESPQA